MREGATVELDTNVAKLMANDLQLAKTLPPAEALVVLTDTKEVLMRLAPELARPTVQQVVKRHPSISGDEPAGSHGRVLAAFQD